MSPQQRRDWVARSLPRTAGFLFALLLVILTCRAEAAAGQMALFGISCPDPGYCYGRTGFAARKVSLSLEDYLLITQGRVLPTADLKAFSPIPGDLIQGQLWSAEFTVENEKTAGCVILGLVSGQVLIYCQNETADYYHKQRICGNAEVDGLWCCKPYQPRHTLSFAVNATVPLDLLSYDTIEPVTSETIAFQPSSRLQTLGQPVNFMLVDVWIPRFTTWSYAVKKMTIRPDQKYIFAECLDGSTLRISPADLQTIRPYTLLPGAYVTLGRLKMSRGGTEEIFGAYSRGEYGKDKEGKGYFFSTNVPGFRTVPREKFGPITVTYYDRTAFYFKDWAHEWNYNAAEAWLPITWPFLIAGLILGPFHPAEPHLPREFVFSDDYVADPSVYLHDTVFFDLESGRPAAVWKTKGIEVGLRIDNDAEGCTTTSTGHTACWDRLEEVLVISVVAQDTPELYLDLDGLAISGQCQGKTMHPPLVPRPGLKPPNFLLVPPATGDYILDFAHCDYESLSVSGLVLRTWEGKTVAEVPEMKFVRKK